ncbi:MULTISPECIES: efflux transporter outer membrane subunit [Rhizobium]|uniref:RND efflux system outer membrane lipoprotein n=2 Tax=Rhizobium favelukesii TaxID=348824 RepID=W6RI08_9HYPH|nr:MULTISPECIES: efflux transporter outer membrane subunit [Rhizobium]MCS0463597.1 efflux transporter outer membrane subunit [Rhizobium favelukesii]UFS84885.1 efflux transporter outer membrane subunit [Rhizobium sp. T136]CDM60449.1 RND efflux system outer membrane lipoprotein [Rhizobium favelukesii]
MTTPLVRLAVLTAILPLMPACVAVGPDYQMPVVLTPSKWNSKVSAATPRLGDWWKNLDDPVLNQLIADGIAISPNVATAKARVRKARANYASAGGIFYPSLDGSGSYTRSGASSGSNLVFKAQWELDLFGANRRGAEAAYYSMEAASEQLRGALVTFIGDIATNYAQVRGVQANIAIAKRSAASQRQTVELTRAQLEAGHVSQVDLLRAETQAASTEARIPSQRITYAKYLNTLSVLTGRSSSALSAMLDKTRPIPSVPRRISVGLPAGVLANRPDIRAAEREYASSTAGVGQKQAALYPSISLSGNINADGTDFGDLALRSTIGWSFGPSLSVPIFQGGKLNAAVDVARATRDQSFIAYRKAVLTALSEVEDTSVSLNQNRLRVAQLRKIMSNSWKINELTLSQYKAGKKSFIDVLTAQRDLFDAETSLAEARTDLVTNYVALHKALGGGWNGRDDVSEPEVIDSYTGPHFVRPTIPASPASEQRPL